MFNVVFCRTSKSRFLVTSERGAWHITTPLLASCESAWMRVSFSDKNAELEVERERWTFWNLYTTRPPAIIETYFFRNFKLIAGSIHFRVKKRKNGIIIPKWTYQDRHLLRQRWLAHFSHHWSGYLDIYYTTLRKTLGSLLPLSLLSHCSKAVLDLLNSILPLTGTNIRSFHRQHNQCCTTHTPSNCGSLLHSGHNHPRPLVFAGQSLIVKPHLFPKYEFIKTTLWRSGWSGLFSTCLHSTLCFMLTGTTRLTQKWTFKVVNNYVTGWFTSPVDLFWQKVLDHSSQSCD